jgi:hypothetical protein
VDDRQADRVWVSVSLSPEEESHTVDGVALQLCTRDGGCLGPRLLLPISGQLAGPLVTRAELRSMEPIPRESRVVAVAWWGHEQIEVSCPSDRGTCMEFHLRGITREPLPDRTAIRNLEPGEREALAAHLPWVNESWAVSDPKQIEPLDTEESLDDVVEDLGLDDENARWLKELLTEDDG